MKFLLKSDCNLDENDYRSHYNFVQLFESIISLGFFL